MELIAIILFLALSIWSFAVLMRMLTAALNWLAGRIERMNDRLIQAPPPPVVINTAIGCFVFFVIATTYILTHPY